MTTRITIALVETMPDCHRESHRAARNWGSYPANGAERHWRCLADADAIVKDDSDGYDHVVRELDIDLDDEQLATLRDAANRGGRCLMALHGTDLCAYDDEREYHVLTRRGWAAADSLKGS